MDDKDHIKRLGGPTKVAEILGYDKEKGGVQRVQNWLVRGIPSKVKLDHPELFLIDLNRRTADRRHSPGRRSTDRKEAA